MVRIRHTIIICAIVVLVAMTSGPRVAQGLGSGEDGFGKLWTRTNPFLIQGTSPIYSDAPSGVHVDRYWDTNHTCLIESAYNEAKRTLAQGWTEPYSKPWINHNPELVWGSGWADQVVAAMTVPNLQGWKLKDEPSYDELGALANVSAGIRTISNQQLVYVNMGDRSAATLDRLFNDVVPDVVQYDAYPFLADGSTGTSWYFDAVMTIRNRAMIANVPYWAYLQSYTEITDPSHRVSSESDMRMNAYSHLTAGYTGLQYFTQVLWPNDFGAALLDVNGDPDTMYWHAQDVNAEVQNLGKALSQLDSTAVRFIPGDDATPTGLMPNWSSGAGGDSHITNVAMDGGQSGPNYENGMIGFYEDYVGEKHFMLTNLNHAAGTSAAATSLDFTVTFDSSVTELLRLNRETGVQEVVPLTSNQLHVTLPGGTGDLYKYNTGDFQLELPSLDLEMVEVTDPGAPVGYTAYDIIATTSTNLSGMELVLEADSTDDIYHSTVQDPDTPDGAFDTYVTMPGVFNVIGAAVDIDPLASQAWDDDDLNVSWAPAGGEDSLPGIYQIARIILKNSASGSYTVKGWQSNDLSSVELTAGFGLLGDVNGDGFVGGGDLNAVLSNWGMAGARRSQGDLTGEGDVGGADYNQVLGNWGAGTPPSEPGAIPEPATLGLLTLGGLLVLLRRR